MESSPKQTHELLMAARGKLIEAMHVLIKSAHAIIEEIGASPPSLVYAVTNPAAAMEADRALSEVRQTLIDFEYCLLKERALLELTRRDLAAPRN